MLPIGEIPEDIRQAFVGYEKFFACKEQFESFLMYLNLTGLSVSHKGNIQAMADLFWEELAKDQPRPTVGTMGRRVMAQVVQQFVGTVIQRAQEGEEAIAGLQQRLTAFF